MKKLRYFYYIRFVGKRVDGSPLVHMAEVALDDEIEYLGQLLKLCEQFQEETGSYDCSIDFIFLLRVEEVD